MAYSQAQADALKNAIATGTLEVEVDGKRVRYRSLEEMQKILDSILDELAAASDTPVTRQIRIYSKKGF